MLTWMLYVVFITLLLSGAALAAERSARLRRARTRWIWVVTILASLAIPTVIASVSIQIPSLVSPAITRKIGTLREMTAVHLAPLTWVRERTVNSAAAPNLNRTLRRCWLMVSAALLAVLLLNGAYASWRKRQWRTGTVAGASVYIAPDAGPAVVGLLRPRIVVPSWLTEASHSHQGMVMAHEQAHLAGRDPQVLTVALFLLVLMPWNVPLWWQLRRLRYAIEVDCDARVLESGVDTRQYGETLIHVSERPVAYVGSVAAMAESRSFLEERITLMVSDPFRWGSVATVVFGCLALALFAFAAEVTPPNAGSPADSWRQAASVASEEELHRYVGSYVLGGHIVLAVSREGSHLFGQQRNLPPEEIFADSEREFWTKLGQHFTFELDEQGAVTGVLGNTVNREPYPFAWPRVDAATAQRILASNEARFQAQTPIPGGEAVLRRLIDGWRTSTPNYADMAPGYRELWKNKDRLSLLRLRWAPGGTVQSVEFLHVDDAGGDVYEVRQEHGQSDQAIYLNADGLIEFVTSM